MTGVVFQLVRSEADRGSCKDVFLLLTDNVLFFFLEMDQSGGQLMKSASAISNNFPDGWKPEANFLLRPGIPPEVSHINPLVIGGRPEANLHNMQPTINGFRNSRWARGTDFNCTNKTTTS